MTRTSFHLLLGAGPDSDAEGGALAPRDADGAFEVALGPIGKSSVRGLMRKSGADVNFRNTIKTIGGGSFSTKELRTLEERVLDAATWDDVGRLFGVETGTPVVLSPNQKETVDGLIRRLGDDPLAKRVQGAYEDALRSGRVTVH